MADLTQILVRIGADTTQAIAGLNTVRNASRAAAADITAVGAALTAGLTVPITAIAKIGTDFAIMQQRATLAFTATQGSAERATQTIKELQIVSDRMGVGSDTLTKMAQRFAGVGFAAEDVVPAVEAIASTVAKFGGGQFEVERVGRAFSQMASKGKVSAEEMTQQLGEVFPAWQMLADATGKSVAELQKQAEQGQLGAGYAIEALLEQMSATSQGFGEQVGNLLPGQLQKLQNAAERALGAMMGPAIEQLAAVIGEVVPYVLALAEALTAMDPATRNMIVGFGAALAAVGPLAIGLGMVLFAITALMSPIGIVAAALAGLGVAAGVAATALVTNWMGVRDTFGPILEGIAATLTGWATSAADWGAGLIIAFAEGMASAIAAIVEVLNAISEIISYWLSPGSPPRLLPDIDKWGALAMQEYINGWTTANFGVLDEIAAMVEDRLRFAARLGDFNLAEALFGTRAGVAQAVNDMRELGSVSEDTLAATRDSAGPAGEEIANIIDTYARWAQAGEDVARIQKELTQINREFEAQLRPLNSQLAEIDRNQQDLADQKRIAELGDRVAKGKADPKELQLLIEEVALRKQVRDIKAKQQATVDAKQGELEKAEGVRDALGEQVEAFKAMNAFQQSNVRLMDELADKIGGGAGGGGGKGAAGGAAGLLASVKGMKLDLPDVVSAGQKIREAWERMELAAKPLRDIFDRIREGVEDPFADMVKSMTKLRNMWLDLTGRTPVKPPGAEGTEGEGARGSGGPQYRTNVGPAKEAMERRGREAAEAFLAGFSKGLIDTEVAFTPFTEGLNRITTFLTPMANRVKLAFESLDLSRVMTALAPAESLILRLSKAVYEMGEPWRQANAAISTVLGPLSQLMVLIGENTVAALMRFAENGITALTVLVDFIGNVFANSIESIPRLMEGFANVAVAALNVITIAAETMVANVGAILRGDWTTVWENVKTLTSGVVAFITTTWDTFNSTIRTILQNIKDGILQTWRDLDVDLKVLVETIITGIIAIWTGLKEKLTEPMTQAIEAITKPFEDVDMKKIGEDMIQRLIDGLLSKLAAASAAASAVAAAVTAPFGGPAPGTGSSGSSGFPIDGTGAGIPAEARAAGGPVSGGVPYMVNEGRRGELLLPRESGYVVPHQGNVATFGNGAFQINLNSSGSNQQDAEELATMVLDRINLGLRGMGSR